jgi:hypothetical protein
MLSNYFFNLEKITLTYVSLIKSIIYKLYTSYKINFIEIVNILLNYIYKYTCVHFLIKLSKIIILITVRCSLLIL